MKNQRLLQIFWRQLPVFRAVSNENTEIHDGSEWEWKIEQPRMARWTTLGRAIEYVTQLRDKTDDPIIKKNADKTIATLEQLRNGCGNASAC